jgi:hypothetical protein
MEDLVLVGLVFIVALIVNIMINIVVIRKSNTNMSDISEPSMEPSTVIQEPSKYISFLQTLNLNFMVIMVITTAVILINYSIINDYSQYRDWTILILDLLFIINFIFIFCVIFKVDLKTDRILKKLLQ